MNRVILFQPEIPPNTGNIARTCACTATALTLIEPLGFSLEERMVRRAGLDYWEHLALTVEPSWDAALAAARAAAHDITVALLSTRGIHNYTEIPADRPVCLVFGPETRGLPRDLLERHRQESYRIPMGTAVRSLNLSNTVALVLYDVLRRQGFPGLQ